MHLFIFWITHGQSAMSFQFGISPSGDESNLHMTPDACLRKHPDAGKYWGQEEMGTTEDEMVGWHHQLSEHEFEQAPWDGERQGSLACCSPWGCEGSDMTEQQDSHLFLCSMWKYMDKDLSKMKISKILKLNRPDLPKHHGHLDRPPHRAWSFIFNSESGPKIRCSNSRM